MLGQTISHFQILDKLGEGGMGIVYRARDLKLDRAVALKFLPRHLSENVEEKERFIQEAKAASALDHPNICTIHEIDETDEGQLFIAMTAYEGETVKQKIRRGALTLEEIIELGIQMTAGLAAAHDRGIIHRDVKPANFMVTSEGVVKILDFGLSKLTNAPTQLTQSGTLMGTAAYMSPEQVQGEEINQQADVWALGVVLYEMATGSKPFRGSNDLSTLYRIVHQEPNAQTDSGRLPTQLRPILRKALAKERNRRYGSMTELQADLERLRADTQSTALPPFVRRVIDPAQTRAERVRRTQILVAVLAVVLAVAVLLVLRWVRPVTPPAAASNTAWVGLVPASAGPTPEWLGAAISELILAELPSREGLRWVRPTLAAGTGADLERASFQGLDEASLRQLQGDFAADRAVSGVVALDRRENGDPRVRVELWVQSTRPGGGVEHLTASGELGNLLGLAARLASDLGGLWGARPLPAGASVDGAAVDQPSDPAVVALLAQARASLRMLDAPTARRLAEQGLARDPGRGALQVVQAAALLQLGREREAREAALAAVTAAQTLPRQTRALYVSWLREAEGDPGAAAALLQALSYQDGPPPLAPIDPQRFDRDLRLVALLALERQVEAAHAILEPYQAVIADDTRLLLAETEIARGETDYRRQRELAMRAAEQAKSENAPFLLARARFFEGEARRRLNELDLAEEALEAAREIYAAAGHVRGEADMLTNLGNVYLDRQDLAAAQTYYEQAARLYGSIGYERLRNRVLGNQSLVLQERGLLEAALQIQKEVQVSSRAAGDLPAESVSLATIGELAILLGRFGEAETAIDQALEVGRRSGSWIMISSALSAKGEFLMLRGELTEAARHLNQAIEMRDAKGDLQYAAQARAALASVRRHQGDLVAAERLYQEALAATDEERNPSTYTSARRGLGEVWWTMGRSAEARSAFEEALRIQDGLGSLRAAETRLVLARWWLDDGKPAEAERIAREVLDDVVRRSEKLLAARAHWLLAEVALARDHLDNAQAEIAGGREQLMGIDCPILSWPLDLSAARLEIARGERTRARTHLETLLAATTKASFLELNLEIRLVLNRLDLDESRTRGSQVRLEQLVAEAEQKGFGRLAKKAKKSLIDMPLN